MPTLRGIKCTVEIGPGHLPLKEYKAKYDDGYVQTFLAVPDSGVNFTVHIKTEGYIAPGLAFFVFMDGEYQCNRNRIGLKLPGYGVDPSEFETEFRMRQKEEKNAYGSFVASDWSFKALDRVSADKAPSLNPQFLNNIGTIEVVALRCKPPDNYDMVDRARTARSGRYAAGYDGAADSPNPGILKNAGYNAMVGKQVRIAMPPTPPVGSNYGETVNAYPMYETPGYGGGMPDGGMQPGFQQVGQGTYDPTARFQAYGNTTPMPPLSKMPYLPGGMAQGVGPGFGPQGYAPPPNFQAQQGMQAFALAGQPQYPQTGPAATPARTMFNNIPRPQPTFSNFQQKQQAFNAGQVNQTHLSPDERQKQIDARRQAERKNVTLDHFQEKEKAAAIEAAFGSELPEKYLQRDQVEDDRKKMEEEWRKRRRGNDWGQGNNANGTQDAQKRGSDHGGKKDDNNAWGAEDAAGAWNNQNDQKKSSDRGGNDKKDSDGWGGNRSGWDKQPSANNGGNNSWGQDHNAQQGAGDWKESKPSSNKGHSKQSSGWGGDNDQKQDAGSWGTPAADQKKDDDTWGGSQKSKNSNGGGSWENKSNSNDKQSNTGWGDNDKSNDKPAWGDDDAKSRHSASSTKSTKSHHRRSGSISSSPDAKSHIKPYFKEWNQPFDKIIEGSESDASSTYAAGRKVYHYPADPLPPVPANKAKSASHGVQTGMGTDYAHLTRRPTYLDSMEKPYAVFSFKYRSPEALSKICGAAISTADLEKRVEKDLLLTLPKHKLVEELMAKRGVSAPEKKRRGESRKGSGGGSEKGAEKGGQGWGGASAAGEGSGGGGGW